MAVVHFVRKVPAADGVLVPASGRLRFTPTARRVVAGAPDVVVLPASFSVQLAAGAADVTLDPTTGAWVWRVEEYCTGVSARTTYVAVPAVAELDDTDLVTVDPATLEPAATPEPIWTTQLAGKVDVSAIGAPDGVAPLGPDSKVPASYLPDSLGGGTSGPVTSADITDATTTGRAVLTATDAPAARTAIGAGTSSLALGTSAGTAMAGDRTFTKTDVGLGNVDNTADTAKPVSTAQAAALAAKADTSALNSHTGNTANPHAVTKAQVGLGNVDNTADAAKPVSTAQQAALDAKLDASQKGAASGVAALDSGSKVPVAQIPDLKATYVTKPATILEGQAPVWQASTSTWVGANPAAGVPGVAVAPSGDTTGATDKANIQAAITNLSAKATPGGTVYLDGTYYINGPILLNTSIRVTGSGWGGTQIHLAAGSNSSMFDLVGGSTSTARWYELSNLLLDGHSESQTGGGAAVNFSSTVQVGAAYANCVFGFVFKVCVQYAYGGGFNIQQVENRTEECFAYRCGTAANFANGFKFSGSDQWIINCTNGESTGDGIIFPTGAMGHRMIGCKSWWSGYQNSSRVSGTTKASNLVNSAAHNYTISGTNHQISACEGQDAANSAFNISGSHCMFNVTCDISAGTHIILGGSDNIVNATIGDGSSHGATPTLINVWSSAVKRNRVVTNYNNPAANGGSNNGVTSGIAGGGATTGFNEIRIGSPEVIWTTAYAATITPDPFLGSVDVTLTGNVTIANTAADRKGHSMEFDVVLTQDATGGRAVAFGADYLGVTAADTTAGKVNRWRFRCVKDKWIQVRYAAY